jgi:hypothetical protein
VTAVALFGTRCVTVFSGGSPNRDIRDSENRDATDYLTTTPPRRGGGGVSRNPSFKSCRAIGVEEAPKGSEAFDAPKLAITR